MRLGSGGGDATLDGNTPERGGGGDGTTQDSARTPKRSAPTTVITPGRAVDGDDAVTADVGATGLPVFWDSPEAAKLFGFSYNNGDDVYGRLKDRIHLLSEVQRSEDGYKRFEIDIEKKPLSTKQIFLFTTSLNNRKITLVHTTTQPILEWSRLARCMTWSMPTT